MQQTDIMHIKLKIELNIFDIDKLMFQLIIKYFIFDIGHAEAKLPYK